jgi:SAM-dependent methyltransferase
MTSELADAQAHASASSREASDGVAIVLAHPDQRDALQSSVAALRRIAGQFRIPLTVHVVTVDASDETIRDIETLGVSVINQSGRGYGALIKAAAAATTSPYVVTLGADGAHPPELLPYLYAMRNKADLVIASRYVAQGFARMPLWRQVVSRALNQTFRRMLDLPFRDLSSSYRLYHRSLVAAISPVMSTDAALQEVLIKSFCEGYSVTEIPMHYIASAGGSRRDLRRLAALGVEYVRTFGAMWTLRNSVASADYDTRAFFSRIPFQRWWQRRRYSIVSEYIGKAGRVLDAGCGSTQLMNRFPQTVGMDYSIRKLRFMRRPGRRLVNGSTFALPFRSEVFDVVISSQVIEHLRDDPRIFDELVRCIVPGGTLVLGTVDYGKWQWPLIERLYGLLKPTGYAQEHITHFTEESLVQRVRSLGLTVERIRFICGGEIIIRATKASGRVD